MNKLFYKLQVLFGITALFLSCADTDQPSSSIHPKPDKPIIQPDSVLIAPQPYYALLFHIDMNDDLLRRQGVVAYTAKQSEDSIFKNYKVYYKSVNPVAKQFAYIESQYYQGKSDTIQYKQWVSVTPQQRVFEQHILAGKKANNQYIVTETFNPSGQLMLVNRENKSTLKNDQEIFTYKLNHIYIKDFSKLGKIYYEPVDNQTTLVSFIQPSGDTTYAYTEQRASQTIFVRYIKGNNEIFEYHYNEHSSLTDVYWKSGTQTKVHIRFTYNAQYLPEKRMVHSYIKSIPSTHTFYLYQMK